MHYLSTRDRTLHFTAAEAIKQGLSRDGGLFLPEMLPALSARQIKAMESMSYQERAVEIMSLFLEDYSREELRAFADAAYSPEKFDDPAVAPVRSLDAATHSLELWHGPTSAFKDMALQMLPHLLYASLKKTGEEGFRDVDHTKIMVFYPKDGVSEIQKLQMVTQEGSNVSVYAVLGNFDDAQTGVKRIFSDEAIRAQLLERGYFLSSANSINWGRVLPQVVYYVSVCCDLVRDGKLKEGEKVNLCVPTGNFGNILSAYYAKCMGAPIGRLICASNRNDVLTEFLRTGVYDRNRPFYTTMSPSMDILISSNLERLLYALSDGNDAEVRSYMKQLNAEGRYQVSDTVLAKVRKLFWAGSCGEEDTMDTIRRYYTQRNYLMDTHTAVAAHVLEQYRAESGDGGPAVIVSTASPYKFCSPVLRAIGAVPAGDGVELIAQLQEATGVKAPWRLAELGGKAVRFTESTEKHAMEQVVLDYLN